MRKGVKTNSLQKTCIRIIQVHNILYLKNIRWVRTIWNSRTMSLGC